MELVVFSAAEQRDDEIQVIVQMFENGLQGFHLRKPLLPAEEIKKIILQIPAHFHPKIMIHAAHELIDTFQLKGLHYPKKRFLCQRKPNACNEKPFLSCLN